LHNEHLNKDDRICLICAAGGQAALAGKTMVDMGYTNVVNVGGFADWQAAGGQTEE
jgi:rhodanese-related sulfurtransferase